MAGRPLRRARMNPLLPHHSHTNKPLVVAKDNNAAAFIPVGLVLGVGIFSSFVLTPYFVKLVYPEWSYGKRFVVGSLTMSVLGLASRAVNKSA